MITLLSLLIACKTDEVKAPTDAVIVAYAIRSVRGIDVLKFQILLDGELWWTGAGAARLLEPRNGTR